MRPISAALLALAALATHVVSAAPTVPAPALASGPAAPAASDLAWL